MQTEHIMKMDRREFIKRTTSVVALVVLPIPRTIDIGREAIVQTTNHLDNIAELYGIIRKPAIFPIVDMETDEDLRKRCLSIIRGECL